MFRKFIIFAVLGSVAGVAFFYDWQQGGSQLQQVGWAFSSVTVIYGLYNLVEFIIVHRMREVRSRYTARKAVSFLAITLAVIVMLRIFVPNPQALLVAYGLMGAGIAIALQDLLKNFAGSITLFVSGAFAVGDRVEVNGVHGDVVDIGLFYSTLLEIREWVDGDQATGRLLSVPNGVVLNGVVKNYTKHYPFLWDELNVVITSESDWREAMHILGTLAFTKTEPTIVEGEVSLQHMREYLYIDARSLKPSVFMCDDQNGTRLTLRYVVEATDRRKVKSELWEGIAVAFAEHPRIALAPVTFASTGVPPVERY